MVTRQWQVFVLARDGVVVLQNAGANEKEDDDTQDKVGDNAVALAQAAAAAVGAAAAVKR